MSSRVVALVEHPANATEGTVDETTRRRLADRDGRSS
jgi:hypothetical protein